MTLEYGLVYDPNPATSLQSPQASEDLQATEPHITPETVAEYLIARAEACFPDDPDTVALLSGQAPDIATAITSAFVALSERFDIPLSPPFNFDFRLLEDGTYAQSDATSIVFDLTQLTEYAKLMEKNTAVGEAWITALTAHEFYHLSQRKRFPGVTEKHSDFLSSPAASVATYRTSRVEQGAELFSAKFLRELAATETDSGVTAARTAVADSITAELRKVLFEVG